MKKLAQFTQDTVYFFAVSCVFFIPFPFYLFPWQAAFTNFVWGQAIVYTGTQFFQLPNPTPGVTSDSANMYVLALLLFMTALGLAGLANWLSKWQQRRIDILAIFRQVFVYYLALQLLKYGFDKVFKSQFYLPEPNTLYTPLGQLSKDILFWSTMGASYAYTVFGGVLEVVAGSLLLFLKTRVVGLLLALGILANVVAINFGFDISVKVYSLILLWLTLILLTPQLARFYQFFILQKETRLKATPEAMPAFFNKTLRVIAQVFIIGLLFIEALYPYLASGHFNDDTAPRPYLHGAYQVVQVQANQQPKPLHLSPVKRFFIHRRGFMIFQSPDDQMKDYKLKVRPKQFLLTDYNLQQLSINYHYQAQDSLLTLTYRTQGQLLTLKAKALNWRKLPSIKPQFHWSIEEVK